MNHHNHHPERIIRKRHHSSPLQSVSRLGCGPSRPSTGAFESTKMFHSPVSWSTHAELQAKKKLELTERLNILLGQPPTPARDRSATELLTHIRDNDALQEICLADIRMKNSWLQHIDENDQHFSLYQDMARTPSVPLLNAIKFNRTHAVKTALELGLDINQLKPYSRTMSATPLEVAIRSNNSDMLQILLDAKVDCNMTNSLNQSPLYAALHTQNTKFAELLLSNGCDPNIRDTFGQTALFCCLGDIGQKQVDPELLQVLLVNGADCNITDGQSGLCALHVAVCRSNEKCCVDLVKTLLEHKVNPNTVTANGMTALHLIASNMPNVNMNELSHKTRCQLVTLLLKYGADPNLVNDDYNSPLHIASQYEYAKLAELLLDNGADPMLRNIDGDMPADLAKPKSGTQRVLQEGMETWKRLTIEKSIERLEEKWQTVFESLDDFELKHINQPIKEHKDKDSICISNLEVKVESINLLADSPHRNLSVEDAMQFDFCCLRTAIQDVKFESDFLRRKDGQFGNGHLSHLEMDSKKPFSLSITSANSTSNSAPVSRSSSPVPDVLSKVCQTVSQMVGFEWKSLFRELSPHDHLQTETIIRELETRYPGQLREQAFQALCHWREMAGKDSDVAPLMQALKDCSLMGIVHVVEDRIPGAKISKEGPAFFVR